jgi:hypothetical protein
MALTFDSDNQAPLPVLSPFSDSGLYAHVPVNPPRIPLPPNTGMLASDLIQRGGARAVVPHFQPAF